MSDKRDPLGQAIEDLLDHQGVHGAERDRKQQLLLGLVEDLESASDQTEGCNGASNDTVSARSGGIPMSLEENMRALYSEYEETAERYEERWENDVPMTFNERFVKGRSRQLADAYYQVLFDLLSKGIIEPGGNEEDVT